MANTLSLLTEDTKNYICTGVLEGKTYRDILKELGLSESTFYNWLWNDYRGIRTRLNEVKREIILRDVENISKEIREMETLNGKGEQNPKLLAIKQKEAEFLRETLLKDHGYSKRIETIGLNINKNEPLDEEQKKKLDKLVKASGIDSIREAEVVEVDNNMAQ